MLHFLQVQHFLGRASGNPDGVTLFRERFSDGLLDPPGRVAAELGTFARKELVGRNDEPPVAFRYDVRKGHPVALEVVSDFHDQA